MVLAMLVPVLALAMMSSACPLYVGVSGAGNIFYDLHFGWSWINATQLERILHNGCKTNASGPEAPVTSVRFAVAPQAPREKVDEVFSLLEKSGWAREKVAVEAWTKPVRKLSGRFYMDKRTFAADEPIALHFEVINSGDVPYWFDTTGLPGMAPCAGYTFEVLEHNGLPPPKRPFYLASTCILNGQFHHVVIEPGGRYTQDIDLRLYLEAGAKGSYVIKAWHSGPRGKGLPPNPLDVHATFTIELR